jgi:hypothetical protein
VHFTLGREIALTDIGSLLSTVSSRGCVKCTLAVLALVHRSRPPRQNPRDMQRFADKHGAKTARSRGCHYHCVQFSPELKGTQGGEEWNMKHSYARR